MIGEFDDMVILLGNTIKHKDASIVEIESPLKSVAPDSSFMLLIFFEIFLILRLKCRFRKKSALN